ncbi:MAG: hypothetical protein GWO87_01530 [Xanthomonadaceae bacterium]|nr:hypothetical protein [Rhodospirillaceae bacterium]NIA17853.1 hypothetical protein [Xanthomonadaceae bacterium]
MEAKIIGVKQLYKNLKTISEETLRGHSFIVVKNSKPVFRIEPINNENDNKKKYTLADFKKLQFKSKYKNLSKDIDKIVYNL